MEKARRDHLRVVVARARTTVQASLEQQLASYGFFPDREPLPAEMLGLEREDAARRLALEGALRREARATAGTIGPEAVRRFVREAGGTWINRLAALRALEVRGLLDPHAARLSDDYGGLSARALRLQELALREGLRPSREEALQAAVKDACRELSESVRVLFDLHDEASLLFPEVRELLALFSDEAEGVSTADWSEPDVLGWVYQYYNTDANAELKRRKKTKGFKYAPDDIPIANQFYSPHWVVRVLVDNTLGRFWLESRARCPMLRFEEGSHTLDEHRQGVPHAARELEAFRAWIDEAPDPLRDERVDRLCRYLVPLPSTAPSRAPVAPRDVRVLDPACGSGHFLLYAFDVLFAMYREQEPDLDPRLIPALILENNLFGIDIDLRAAQLAAFNLYMKARATLAALDPKAMLELKGVNIVVADAHIGDDPRRAELLERFRDEPELQALYRRVLDDLDHTNVLGSLLKVRGEFEKLFGRVDEARASRAGRAREKLEKKGQRPLFTLTAPAPRKQFTTSGTARSFTLEELLDELRDIDDAPASGQDIGARLFSTDLGRAAGVLGLLSQQYDVVLMNPPYGDMPPATKLYLKGDPKQKLAGRYPRTHSDLYAAFLDQGVDLLQQNGFLGALVPWTYTYQTTHQAVRTDLFTKDARPELLHEYGYGILDGATVGTVATVARKVAAAAAHPTTFHRLSHHSKDHEKLSAFVSALPALVAGCICREDETYIATIGSLASVPGSPYAYWASESLRNLFVRFPPLDRDQRGVLGDERPDAKFADAKQGLATADDPRFLRFWWEVSPTASGRGRRWVPFVKGGKQVHFYTRIDLVLDWHDDGKEIRSWIDEYRQKHPGQYLKNLDRMGAAAVTWPRASWRLRRFGLVPVDCMFADKGPCIFPIGPTTPAKVLDLLNSSVGMISLLMQTPERMWEVRTVGAIPVPTSIPDNVGELSTQLEQIVRQSRHEGSETCRDYVAPSLLRLHRETGVSLDLTGLLARYAANTRAAEEREVELIRELDRVVSDLYDLSAEDRALVERELARRSHGGTTPTGTAVGVSAADSEPEADDELAVGDDEGDPGDDDNDREVDLGRDQVARWLSQYVRQAIELDPDGIVPLVATRGEASLLTRVRDVMTADLGPNAAQALEAQAPAHLGARDLADWLETAYFPWHVQLYKSRPLFWLLSSEGFERRASRLTFRAFVHARRVTADTLPRLDSYYLEPVIERAIAEANHAEAALAGTAGAEKRAAEKTFREWTSSVEALRTFRSALTEVIRGPVRKEVVAANAKWLPRTIAEVRGGQDTGRGYRPEVDYGVRVNIKPLVEKRLLPRAVLSRLG